MQVAYGIAQTCTIFPHDGENRPQLDNDLEDIASLIVEVKRITYNNQMSCTAYWQKLRCTLDQPEDERLQQNQQLHESLPRLFRLI